MATSGSYDYDRTCAQIINRAYRILTRSSDTPDATDEARILEGINVFVKALQTKHVHLWSREWTSTLLTISVDDFALDAKVIGVEKAFIRHDDDDDPLEIIKFTDYLDIPDKTITGQPTMIAFNRTRPWQAYLYPVPDAADYYLNLLQINKLQDFDATTHDPDFPSIWLAALTWGTVSEMGPEFGADLQRQAMYDSRGQYWLKLAMGSDFEEVDNDFVDGAFPVR